MSIRAMLIVLTLTAANVQALAEEEEGRIMFGQGSISCGAWTNARETKSPQQGLAIQWVMGYLSGLNKGSKIDGLRNTDFDGLVGWIDNYCRAHPLDAVIQAALKLMEELRTRAQRR